MQFVQLVFSETFENKPVNFQVKCWQSFWIFWNKIYFQN